MYVCVCVCVCAYVVILRMLLCVYACMYACMYVHSLVCIHEKCMHVCMYVCTAICICPATMYAWMCACMHCVLTYLYLSTTAPRIGHTIPAIKVETATIKTHNPEALGTETCRSGISLGIAPNVICARNQGSYIMRKTNSMKKKSHRALHGGNVPTLCGTLSFSLCTKMIGTNVLVVTDCRHRNWSGLWEPRYFVNAACRSCVCLRCFRSALMQCCVWYNQCGIRVCYSRCRPTNQHQTASIPTVACP